MDLREYYGRCSMDANAAEALARESRGNDPEMFRWAISEMKKYRRIAREVWTRLQDHE